MTTINLKDFYAWYTHDEYIEVSDEVAAELKADKLYEAAHQRRTTRNKAQYSLDCDDGIEYSACLHEPTPQELLDRMELFVHLWNALNSLPEVQGVRVEAHLILGKSYRQIARESFRAASHSRTVAAAAAFNDSQCSLMGILIVRSQRANTPSVSPRPSLPMAMAQRL